MHDERGTSQISKLLLRVDEPAAAAAVVVGHGNLSMLGCMTGERVEACWGKIMRGMRTQSSQLVPKFVGL